jgi:hypothetical protein
MKNGPRSCSNRKFFCRRLIDHWVAFLAILVVLSLSQPVVSQAQDDQILTPDALRVRGKEFRAGIESAYKELQRKGNPLPEGKSDITQLTLKYIPVGTSFQNAGSILKFAGFDIFPLSTSNHRVGNLESGVLVARIRSLDPDSLFAVKVYVKLTPKKYEDFDSGVALVKATFLIMVP